MQPAQIGYSNFKSNEHGNHPKVSIVILNWNGLKVTIECLESLKKITYPNYEVIVVDNGSKGDDVEFLRQKYGNQIHVIKNEKNYGLSKGRNIGIRYALETRADYIQILDNDVMVAPDFLSQLIDVAQTDTNIGVLGPKLYSYDEPKKMWYAGRYMSYWTGLPVDRAKGEIDRGQFEDIVDVDYAPGGSMLMSRNALLTAGLLDERFFFWWEDVDFCTRVTRAGFRVVFVPHAKMWVKENAPEHNENREADYGYYFIRNRFILLIKHCNKLQLLTSTLCFILMETPRLLVKYWRHYRSWTMLKYSIKGIWDILVGSNRREQIKGERDEKHSKIKAVNLKTPKILVDSSAFESKGFMAIVIGLAKCLKASIPDSEIVVLSHHVDKDKELNRFGFEVRQSPWVWTQPGRGFSTILRYAILSSFDLLSFITVRIAQKFNFRIKLLPDDYDVVIHYDPDWYSEPERSTWGTILPFIRLFILRMSCSRPYATLPSSMGPFKSRPTRWVSKLVLNRLNLLALRDEVSYDCVCSLQLTKPQILLASDLAFLCDPAPKEKVEEIIQVEGITRSNKPFIGFCPSRGPTETYAFSQLMSQEDKLENYIKIMAQVMDYIAEKFDATVCLISHHDGDVKLCQQIYETVIHKERVAYLHKEYLADELKGIIGSCDMFLGSLMHSAIASTSMGVPTISIAYADKFYRLIGKTMGQEKYIIDIRDKEPKEFLTEIEGLIDSLWANRDNVKQELIERVKAPQERAWSYANSIKELIS